jgi:NIMA (never in mitosis gene a)-related kinase
MDQTEGRQNGKPRSLRKLQIVNVNVENDSPNTPTRTQTVTPKKQKTKRVNIPPGLVSDSTLDDYVVGKYLGKGKFSKVFRAKRKSDGLVVVLKRLVSFNTKSFKEVELMKQCEHPNIVHLIDCFVNNKDDSPTDDTCELILVLQYANGGDMKQQLNYMRAKRDEGKPSRFNESSVWKYFIAVAKGVKHMHERCVAHRDLKPANLFFNRNGTKTLVQIGDLGLGRGLEHSLVAKSKVGTPLYMSPEVIQGQIHDYKADIWSLGCILYELACLKSPFKEPGLNLPGLMKKITTLDYHDPPCFYSNALRSLVKRMLALHPIDRPDIGQVLSEARAARNRWCGGDSKSSSRSSSRSSRRSKSRQSSNDGTSMDISVPLSLQEVVSRLAAFQSNSNSPNRTGFAKQKTGNISSERLLSSQCWSSNGKGMQTLVAMVSAGNISSLAQTSKKCCAAFTGGGGGVDETSCSSSRSSGSCGRKRASLEQARKDALLLAQQHGKGGQDGDDSGSGDDVNEEGSSSGRMRALLEQVRRDAETLQQQQQDNEKPEDEEDEYSEEEEEEGEEEEEEEEEVQNLQQKQQSGGTEIELDDAQSDDPRTIFAQYMAARKKTTTPSADVPVNSTPRAAVVNQAVAEPAAETKRTADASEPPHTPPPCVPAADEGGGLESCLSPVSNLAPTPTQMSANLMQSTSFSAKPPKTPLLLAGSASKSKLPPESIGQEYSMAFELDVDDNDNDAATADVTANSNLHVETAKDPKTTVGHKLSSVEIGSGGEVKPLRRRSSSKSLRKKGKSKKEKEVKTKSRSKSKTRSMQLGYDTTNHNHDPAGENDAVICTLGVAQPTESAMLEGGLDGGNLSRKEMQARRLQDWLLR